MNAESQQQIGTFDLDLSKFIDSQDVVLEMPDYEGASLTIKIKGVLQEKNPTNRLPDNVNSLMNQDEEQKNILKKLSKQHLS